MLGHLAVVGAILFLAVVRVLEGVDVGDMDGMLEQCWFLSSRDEFFEAVWLGVDSGIPNKQAKEIVRASGWVIEVGGDEVGHAEDFSTRFPGAFMQERMAVG